ncbi:cell division protein FtsL [Palleronia sp. LCG004]|uniref:cell division protein FtsL n=1 Tax=Palleronia sp. LCG004 TaxID=3079304 RepID=UPI00294336A1|nr:cell division protein FtsL [Palleronia sp. LCG004]WOI55330.1 cell division protein FtsL [Palleronia sp. LCG004]
MRTVLYLLPGVAVIGLAFWAYSENYETQEVLKSVDRLQSRIGAERETLSILRAEWAYLNRPERLRDLAELNFDRLGLLPLAPEHFALVNQVGYPPDKFALDPFSLEAVEVEPIVLQSDGEFP